jgi:methylenetetrahydrofolate reductase (NADPH)
LDEAFATAVRDGREELLALAHCTALCDRLIGDGVEDLHFYTLNRPHLTREVLHALGILPEVALEKVA